MINRYHYFFKRQTVIFFLITISKGSVSQTVGSEFFLIIEYFMYYIFLELLIYLVKVKPCES